MGSMAIGCLTDEGLLNRRKGILLPFFAAPGCEEGTAEGAAAC